jgi:hypothetical protein
MVRPLYWNGSKEEQLMHAISRSGRALLLGTMLGALLVVPMLADQKGVILSADGERRLIDLPASAFGGIPHDPSAQGGSPGGVMPILVSTDWFPAKPIFREPFRLREAPRHEIETRLEPGDSTAAQIFQPSLSDFYPQALDAFRWFDAIGPNDLTPPDTNIAVGPSHVVVVTNDDWAIYDRNGNEQFRVDMNSWRNSSDFFFDPRVVYDYWNGRWVILYLRGRGSNFSQGSWWTLMISDDSNPHGNWIIYDFNARLDGSTDRNQWVDFPHIGFDYEAVYLSGNMYDVGGGFRYAKVRILWKSQIYNGSSAPWYDFWDLPPTIAPAQGYRVLIGPRHHYWAHIPGGGGNYVRVYRIENPTAWHQGSGTPNLVHQADIGVGAYSPPPNAREPGRGQVLWTVDSSILDKSRLNYPYLYTCHHVGVSGVVGSKYYRLDVSNNTAPRDALIWFGTGYDGFFPTLEATRDEDMAMGLNISNGDAGSPYYVTFAVYPWLEGDPGIGGGIGLRFGSGVAGEGRWGDYSGSHLDSCDYRTVWLAGEHARPNTWMTSAHEITLRKIRSALSCAYVAGQRGATVTLSATLTRTDTNAGIASAPVDFYVDGGYVGSAATNSSGVAQLNYTIPNSASFGNHTVTVEFNYCPSNDQFSWSRSDCTLRVLLEVGDAGDLPETSQSTPSGALPVIDGVMGDNDVDMYAIYLPNPAAFTATTVGGASFDTQLWLFDSAGKGVAFNDDSSGTLSTIDNSSGCLSGRPAGVYYLAISSYNRDALGCSGRFIWNNSPFITVRCPDGPERTSRVNSWMGSTTAGGIYTITLTNAQGANRGDPADCCIAHNGDVTGNGCVDDADLLAVLFAFGNTGSNLGRVDVNCDGVVDDADLLQVLFNFGSGC